MRRGRTHLVARGPSRSGGPHGVVWRRDSHFARCPRGARPGKHRYIMHTVGTPQPIFVSLSASYRKLAEACSNALDIPLTSGPSAFFNVGPPSTRGSGILFTMWDADDLPATHRDHSAYSVLIVPSEYNKKIFRKYFKGPIEVCPLFADTSYSHLPPARPFGFITVARDDNTNNRKDTDRLPALFTKAFPTQPDVFLTVKMSPYCKKRWTYDKRIDLQYSEQTKQEYREMLQKHHCGIFLSGAEGWNLPACELAAMGRPSILIPLNGPAVFTTPQTSWHLPYKLVPSPKKVYGGVGRIGRADDTGIIHAMREAYSDQLLLAEKALASAKASHEYTEARFAQRLRSIVNRYG